MIWLDFHHPLLVLSHCKVYVRSADKRQVFLYTLPSRNCRLKFELQSVSNSRHEIPPVSSTPRTNISTETSNKKNMIQNIYVCKHEYLHWKNEDSNCEIRYLYMAYSCHHSRLPFHRHFWVHQGNAELQKFWRNVAIQRNNKLHIIIAVKIEKSYIDVL